MTEATKRMCYQSSKGRLSEPAEPVGEAADIGQRRLRNTPRRHVCHTSAVQCSVVRPHKSLFTHRSVSDSGSSSDTHIIADEV